MEVSALQAIQKRIHDLREDLEQRRRALPRHTIRPHQWMAIGELEDQIRILEGQISFLPAREGGPK